MGYSYYNGQGVKQDYTAALKWFRNAADRDYAPAQYQLGLCFYNGHGVAKNDAEAYAWWSSAAKTEELAAQGFNALVEQMSAEQVLAGCRRMKELRAQIEARLPDRELLALKGRAEEGDTETQSRLGVSYALGQGVATNYVKAVNWWRKAAEQNSALAQSCLGTCYYLGQGVDKNYEEAVKWYRKAAEQNRPEAQYSLALCYANGEGVAKDAAEAAKWYQKAAEQNLVEAQNSLGVCYAKGEGVAKDDLQAVKWFRKAAEGGELNALNALAWILATSRNSAVRDGSDAVVLAEKAAAARHYKNPATLDTLAAAYAEAGQFEKAVSTEQEAIALLQKEAEKSDYRTRLQLFEGKVSYRSKD